MLNEKTSIELKIIVENEKVIGCSMYYEPTAANLHAMCYIRRGLFNDGIFFCNGALVIFCEGNYYPFVGKNNQMYDLYLLLRAEKIKFRDRKSVV